MILLSVMTYFDGAVGGNAAKGAVIGAGHSRREERRTERKKK
jgi:hypothetical protein